MWRYPALNAQFDFPVFKTDEAIKAERDSVVRQYQPYFNYNDDVEKQQVERFGKTLRTGYQDSRAATGSTISPTDCTRSTSVAS